MNYHLAKNRGNENRVIFMKIEEENPEQTWYSEHTLSYVYLSIIWIDTDSFWGFRPS